MRFGWNNQAEVEDRQVLAQSKARVHKCAVVEIIDARQKCPTCGDVDSKCNAQPEPDKTEDFQEMMSCKKTH